jgi:hypothetical protein
MAPHTLSFSYFAENITAYAAVLQVAFVAALIWSLRQAAGARDRLLVWAFGLAHVIGSLLSFGSGAVINPFLDAMLSLVLIAGVGLPLLLRLVEGTRFPVAALALLLLVPFFLRAALEIPRRWNYDSTVDSLRVRHEGEFASLAEFLRKQPGPALCENPLLCYEAGKPRDFDAADLSALVKTGGLPEAALLQMLERREFGAVQLEWGNEPVRPSARKRFSEAFLLKLFATYKPAIRTSDALIFTPVK